MKKLIFVETDSSVIRNFEHNLKKEKLDEYALIQIFPDPDSKKDPKHAIDSCVNQVVLYSKENNDIYGIFIDICIVSGESNPIGIQIATKLREYFLQIPIFNITNKTKHDFEFDSISLATLENIDGVFIKSFLEGDTFSKERFEAIFHKAHYKRSITISRLSDTTIEPKKNNIDIAILTALEDPEFKTVKKIIDNFKPIIKDNYSIIDNTIYYEGKIQGKSRMLNVVAASDSRMGMPAISSLSTRLINTFRPDYIILLGIAAGIKDKTNIGDILIAEYSWDYGSGKSEYIDEKDVFHPYINQLKLDENIRNIFIKYQSNTELLNKIRERYPTPEDTLLKIHIGPFASGAAVIANDKFVDEVKEQHKKLIGFDMEAYGVYIAAESFPTEIKPKVIIAKSVSDFGTSTKNNPLQKHHQSYAAYTCCEFIKEFIKNEL